MVAPRRASEDHGLKRPAIEQYQRALTEQSRHKSNKVMRVLSIVLQFAVDEGYLESNPATGLKLRRTPPRSVVWSAEAVDRFCATAINAGRASMALAVKLAVNLGQREGDVLRLTWAQHDANAFKIRQRKTGEFIEVPITAELATALAGDAQDVHPPRGERDHHEALQGRQFPRGVRRPAQGRGHRRRAVHGPAPHRRGEASRGRLHRTRDRGDHRAQP